MLGPERGSLSPELVERCEFVVKIPTRFCINVGVAGALVMYDRMISLGRFAERPVRAGGPIQAVAEHVHGKQLYRTPKSRLDQPFEPMNTIATHAILFPKTYSEMRSQGLALSIWSRNIP